MMAAIDALVDEEVVEAVVAAITKKPSMTEVITTPVATVIADAKPPTVATTTMVASTREARASVRDAEALAVAAAPDRTTTMMAWDVRITRVITMVVASAVAVTTTAAVVAEADAVPAVAVVTTAELPSTRTALSECISVGC